MRTTVNIDSPILHEVKLLQRAEGKSLGQVVTELLTEALSRRRQHIAADKPRFSWVSKPMNAKVDLADKEALYSLLDQR